MSSNKDGNKGIKVLGLTGGIGTGKSTAAAYLREKGFTHIDADEISRAMTADGSPMLEVLDGEFGAFGRRGDGRTEILNADGSLDRKALASIIFRDDDKRTRLNAIMFRAIIEEIDRRVEEYRSGAARDGREGADGADGGSLGVMIDAPLLFEAGIDDRCDTVLVIVADRDARIRRVCARDGLTEREVADRINSQMDDADKILRADAVIDNSGDIGELQESLDEFIEEFFA